MASYQPLAAHQGVYRTASVADALDSTMPNLQHGKHAGNVVDLGWQFSRRLWRLCCIINITPAIVLVIMSVLEAIIISYVGTISSRFYQDAYCSNLAFYSLKGIDNPDQRIAQDIPLLTAGLADVVAVFGSWLQVAAAGMFFLTGLMLQRLVMLPVSAAVFAQEAAEGSYRYKHMRFRAWASEIALYSTKCLEYGGLVVNFVCLAAAVFGGTWQQDEQGSPGSAGGMAARVSMASFYLLTLINSFTQAGTQVYPATFFTSAPLTVVKDALQRAAGAQHAAQEKGKLSSQDTLPPNCEEAASANTFGGDDVIEISGAATQKRSADALWAAPVPPVVGASATSAQDAAAGGADLSSLLPAAMSRLLVQSAADVPATCKQPQRQQPVLLSCMSLSVDTPAGVPVVHELSMQLAQGSSLLIRGPSGCGKSTLQVGLSYLLSALPQGLDTACEDWLAVLSPGEMQRLAIARTLLHRPQLAVLDEATASLPGEEAVLLYQVLQQAGVTVVSVGHSCSLQKVHEHVLSIAGDGSGRWQLSAGSAC
eukprot:gene11726-11870_t